MKSMKDYCDNETSRELKELGFPTKVTFIGEQATIEIPINSGWIHLYEAQKWLREEKHLHIEIRWFSNLWYEYEVKEAEGKVIAEGSAFPTYEEALSTAVYMAAEYLKEN